MQLRITRLSMIAGIAIIASAIPIWRADALAAAIPAVAADRATAVPGPAPPGPWIDTIEHTAYGAAMPIPADHAAARCSGGVRHDEQRGRRGDADDGVGSSADRTGGGDPVDADDTPGADAGDQPGGPADDAEVASTQDDGEPASTQDDGQAGPAPGDRPTGSTGPTDARGSTRGGRPTRGGRSTSSTGNDRAPGSGADDVTPAASDGDAGTAPAPDTGSAPASGTAKPAAHTAGKVPVARRDSPPHLGGLPSKPRQAASTRHQTKLSKPCSHGRCKQTRAAGCGKHGDRRCHKHAMNRHDKHRRCGTTPTRRCKQRAARHP
jgi:hypothetical protein